MQGLSITMTSGFDHEQSKKIVLADRKERQRDREREARALKIHKRRLKERLKEGRDWPIAVSPYGNLERAELDVDEVHAPLPDDLKEALPVVDEKMALLRVEADRHVAFAGAVVEIDETLLLARRREREQERHHRERVTGPTWSEDIVEARLEEAFKTLFRASNGAVGPRAFGSAMPHIIREVSDLVHQAGNKSLRNAIAHRFKGAPSREEVQRADDALTWASRYLLQEHPDLATFANLGAMWKAWGAKINQRCKAIGVSRQQFYRDRKEAIRKIVEGLKRDGEAPL